MCILQAISLFPDIGCMIRVRDKENGDFSGLPNEWFTIFIVIFNLIMSLEHKALKKEFAHFKALTEKQPCCTQVQPEFRLSQWSPTCSFPSWSIASLAHWQLFTRVAEQPLVVCDFWWIEFHMCQCMTRYKPNLIRVGDSWEMEPSEHQEKQEPAWDCLVVLSEHCFLWAATQMGSALHQKCRGKVMRNRTLWKTFEKHACSHFPTSSCCSRKSRLATFLAISRSLSQKPSEGRVPDARLSERGMSRAGLSVLHQKHKPSALHTCLRELSQVQAVHAFGIYIIPNIFLKAIYMSEPLKASHLINCTPGEKLCRPG